MHLGRRLSNVEDVDGRSHVRLLPSVSQAVKASSHRWHCDVA